MSCFADCARIESVIFDIRKYDAPETNKVPNYTALKRAYSMQPYSGSDEVASFLRGDLSWQLCWCA